MPYSPILYGDRPSPPSTWARTIITQADARRLGLIPNTTTVVSYPTTFHHNIPWKTLRDSWNIIYTFFDNETVEQVFNLYAGGNDKLFRSLKEIKSSVGPNAKNCTSGTFQLWMERLEERGHLAHLETSKQMTADERDSLRTIVAWQQWNIVEGPKESVRVEDPGSDDFDDFRFIDQALYDRFQRVYVYFEALELLIAQYGAAQNAFCDLENTVASWIVPFKAALEKAQPLSSSKLVPFDLRYWQLVKFGGKTTATVESQQYALMAKKNITRPLTD